MLPNVLDGFIASIIQLSDTIIKINNSATQELSLNFVSLTTYTSKST